MLAWNPASLIKEWECVDLSMDTMHLKDPLFSHSEVYFTVKDLSSSMGVLQWG